MDPSIRRRRLIARGAAMVVVMSAWFFIRFNRFRRMANRRRGITYGPMSKREHQRALNLGFLHANDDTGCIEMLRMRRAPFFQLCDLFRSRGLLRDSVNAQIEEQVAMFLFVVGHNTRFRVIKRFFVRSTETVSRYFHEVLYAVGELRTDMITDPATSVHPKINNSTRWNPFFKDCVGAIDGTHVLARVPIRHRGVFTGRKNCPTQQVMAAVDFDLRFTYVLAGWEGSARDARILAHALEKDDGLKVPTGKFYLVDAGYAVRPGFLPPYRGTRYHLSEFGVRRPQNPRELFNLRHSSLRVTVERAFGSLKNRFKVLYNKPFHTYRTQVKLVLACCILHNWILRFGVDEIIPSEEDWEPNPLDEHGPNDNEMDNATWVAKRDTWANQMWETRHGVH